MFPEKNTNQPNGFSEWSLDLPMWQHKRTMFMLNNKLSRKLLFWRIERLLGTAVGILFVRMKPFTSFETKVEIGEAYDTSFEKL